MADVAVVTDSTADLGALAADNGVEVVPLTVTFGNEHFRDGIDLMMDEFYQRLTRAGPPVTAAPSPDAFAAVYRKLFVRGASGVVSLHLSSELSATFNNARIAAEQVDAQRIRVIDTRSVSLGLGLLALAAAEDARAGKTLDEVADRVAADAPRVELYATIPTLTYLARGGRIGQLQSVVGNVLKIVPIITLRDGVVAEYAKVRTFTRAVDQVVAIAISRIGAHADARCAVLHAAAADLAATIAERIREAAHPRQLIINPVGPTVGTHAGPGAVGVFLIP